MTQQSAIRFFKMDEKFRPTIWFMKRKLPSIIVCETGSETTASTVNEKRKTSLPLRQFTDIYCSCNRRETFNFQLSSMTTKCVHFYGQWPNQAKNLVLMPTIHPICFKYMMWFNFFGQNFISLSFKLIVIHYHTPKQKEIKFEQRTKLNPKISRVIVTWVFAVSLKPKTCFCSLSVAHS